jgi:choline-sulfatase
MGDDHAAYVYGAYGNPKAETPNLDRLARTAVRFTRAYVNCPMCTPSRQSLLTGRLPHSVGVTQLTTPLGDEPVTLADLLKENGYATAAIGKMHFNSDRKHGFDLLLDHAQHREHLKRNPPKPVPEDIEVLPDWRPFKDHARVWLNGMYVPYGAYDKDMAGTWFAEKAAEYLKTEREEPFFLIASFYEPHSPFRFPIEFADRFHPGAFEVPPVGPEDDWQIPEIYRDLTDDEKRRIAAAYYTSTAFMDKNAGIVLDALKESGHAEDTFVIYLGDHGYDLGHHGRFEKHCFYEQSVRAPLVMRLPGTTGNDVETDALVEFIDLFPTVAEVCGVERPDEVEGRSLLPFLEGETDTHRESVFSEYTENEEAMVRTERYKYIYTSGLRERQDGYATGRPLPGRTRILFDLEKDPAEMCNKASDPEYAEVVAQLEKEMLGRFKETYPTESETPPAGLSGPDLLDWYLIPRDKKD